MMTITLSSIIMSSCVMAAITENPIKIVNFLLMMASGIFFSTWSMSMSSVYPVIFFLMFIGGVLLMFMVLSSSFPNRKSRKKSWMIMTFMMISWSLMLSQQSFLQESTVNLLMSYSSLTMKSITTILILIYFSAFLTLVSKTKGAMRYYV